MSRTKGAELVPLRHTTNAEAYRRFLRPERRVGTPTQNIQWMIQRKLMEISMNRFTWTGMEELGINVRWLEMSLNFTALSVFRQVKSPEYGEQYEALRAGAGTGLTRTGDPTSFWLYGMDGSNEEVALDDCVPIWANYMRMPDWDIIDVYSSRLANLDTTIDINIKQLRHPKILKTTTNTSQSIRQIQRQMDQGADVIELDVSSLDPADAVQVLDFELDPNTVINTHILRTREWSECMTFLGINNSNQDKKERLTAAETAGNDDVIATVRETNLKSRRIGCQLINDKYFNGEQRVWVDYTTDMKTAVMKDSEDGDDTDPNADPNGKVGA